MMALFLVLFGFIVWRVDGVKALFRGFLGKIGCETSVVNVHAIQELGLLSLYHVSYADLLTGKDDEVTVKYLVKADVSICMDFGHIRISSTQGNPHLYQVVFPEFIYKQARVDHNDSATALWELQSHRGKSGRRVEKEIFIAAEKAVIQKAKGERERQIALRQAKQIVEVMICAADPLAKIHYAQ